MRDRPLMDVYLHAVYTLVHDGRTWEFSFSRSSLPHAHPLRIDVPCPWAILSAANPMSLRLDDAENERRDRSLASGLQRACVPRGPASGRSPDGAWHETGRVVFKQSRQVVLSLARTYGQRAVIWGDERGIGILDCPTERLVRRPIFGLEPVV